MSSSGCKTLTGDVKAIPVNRVPAEVLSRPKEDAQQISISRLRQDTPKEYLLGPGDVLGVYIENVLGEEGENPPVHFPEAGDQPPALGFPVPIREDGTIQLPYIPSLKVEGLTLTKASDLVRDSYIENEILQPDQTKNIVTLIRRREFRVTVIREETGGQDGVSKRGTGATIDLPAYENDVLRALNETGGLPGLDAKNELVIIKSGYKEGEERDRLVSAMLTCKDPWDCNTKLPDAEGSVRIPLRFFPEQPPHFTQEDIILENGDIVYIAARDTEKFYTAGTLRGGEHLLPRDYSIDVLEAIAIVGGNVGSGGTGIGQGQGQGGGGNQGGTGCQPSNLIVLRELPCGGKIPIKVDLNAALTDPSQRILVQPGDTLILKYTLEEELINSARQLVQFNFLLNGLGGGGFSR
ncbi:polysaccharide biosynthesis/export family protein [bacterium]|nr:polysaccharide biosynthesis/export family protein [bacterium]